VQPSVARKEAMSENNRLYSVKQVMGRVPLSRSTLYQELDSGRLKSVKVGRRRLIAESQLIEYIDNLIVAAAPEGDAL
jgi:excisionase family DNA binding protein